MQETSAENESADYLALPFDLVPDLIRSPGNLTTSSWLLSCFAAFFAPGASRSFESYGRGRNGQSE